MTKLLIIQMIILYSNIYGVNPQTSLAVAKIESNFNPNAISETNDYGVFQLNEKSFPEYTKEQLLEPKLNIIIGIKYLAKMQKECNHKFNNQWLVCYNFGVKNSRKVKYPEKWPYVVKINRALASWSNENASN